MHRRQKPMCFDSFHPKRDLRLKKSAFGHPVNVFGEPLLATSPQLIGAPFVWASRPFTKTVELPANAVPWWQPFPGQQCGTYLSPVLTSARPFTKTFVEAVAGRVGGQQPWPVLLSIPRRIFGLPMARSNNYELPRSFRPWI